MKTCIRNPFSLPALIAGLGLMLAGRVAAQSPPSVTIQPTNNPVLVTVGNNVCFAVSVTGTGPFSYRWQHNGTNLPNGIITTVARNGTNGFSGDGGAATNAKLNFPTGVAVDAAGNLFIADYWNNRIRKVGTSGIITTVAGGGGGYHAFGGAATNAELYGPSGVAVDTAGNLFIADSETNVIREVGTNGIINTVAGNGFPGYSGDGGVATNAELFYPSGVAVDAAGNLIIADSGNNVIRKVGTNGIIRTVAGNGYGAGTGLGGYSGDGAVATNAELYGPSGVAVDATGNLFIVDSENQRIRKVDTSGIITTVAGNGTAGYSGDGGAATNAELNLPIGVAVDARGNLFIADEGNQRIRKVVIQSPTLCLTNVGVADAGGYDVVVSSPYGSVTSSVVNLTVTLPVVLSAPQLTGSKTNFTFVLSGPAGSNYVLQDSTNLLNWSPVSTSTIPVSGSITLSNAISGYNRRFYRAYLQ